MLADKNTLENLFVNPLEDLLRKGKQVFLCLIIDVIYDGFHNQSGFIFLGFSNIIVFDIDHIALLLVCDVDLLFYFIQFKRNGCPVTNLHRGEDHLTSRLYVLYLIGEALAFTI